MMRMPAPRITGYALAVLAAVAIPSVALQSAASAATTTATASSATVRPSVWQDTGVDFASQPQCTALGQQAVSSGYAAGYSCQSFTKTVDGVQGTWWELWLDVVNPPSSGD